jgi:tetratricopeptide (TPR) repeat protein
MTTNARFAIATIALCLAPIGAQAHAEAGVSIDNVELRTIAGGKERVLSPKMKVNLLVFFRTGQERSVDALKQMAACEKELAGKAVYWAAVVSGSEPLADVKAVVEQTGIRMPVLIDEGDVLYDRLGIRLHPMVGIADAKFVLAAMEPYRQIEYCDVIKTRIKMLLGEADQAALDKVLNPEKSPLPGADLAKKAMRDVNMARRLFEIGQYAESVKFAQKAVGVAEVPAAYTVMGKSYAKLGKCPDAEQAFAKALELDPKDQDAAAGKGSCK